LSKKDPLNTEDPVKKADPGIEGTRLYLKALDANDPLEPYLQWMNDPAVLRYTDSRSIIPCSKDRLKRYIQKITEDADSILFAIREKSQGLHIGNIKVGPFDRVNGLASVGILVGSKSHWGQGVGTEAIRLVSGYAFREMGVRKLTAGCIDANKGAIRAFEKAGFKIECLRKRHRMLDLAEHDVVMLCRFNDTDG
jgi:RimJ/RimL family protein N-acetyltransferase